MPIAAVLLALGAACASQPPGTFHAGEAIARDAQRWLALEVGHGRARLATATVRVQSVEDALVEAPGGRTGRLVTSADVPQALMFLRGPGLRAGPVVLAAVADIAGAAGGMPQRGIDLAGARHRLATHCSGNAVRSQAKRRRRPAPSRCTRMGARSACTRSPRPRRPVTARCRWKCRLPCTSPATSIATGGSTLSSTRPTITTSRNPPGSCPAMPRPAHWWNPWPTTAPSAADTGAS